MREERTKGLARERVAFATCGGVKQDDTVQGDLRNGEIWNEDEMG